MEGTTILSPAFGRDYKKKADVLADFEAQKDFIIQNIDNPYHGKPCSCSDFHVGDKIEFRYGKMRKQFQHTVW
jgi:hypothetical protein